MGIEPKNLTLRLASSLQRDKHSKSSLCRISDCAQQTAIFCVLKKFTTDRKTSTSPQISDKVLKRSLSIFSDLIFDSKVDRGIPNLAAAAVGPDTRPRVSFSATSIMCFSCARSLRGSSTCCFDSGVRGGGCGNQFSSIEKISVSLQFTYVSRPRV